MAAADFSMEVLAFQALCALDKYEQTVSAMVADWPDPEHYAEASAEIDEVRSFIGGIPTIAAPWVTVLISHTELVQALWARGREGAQADDQEQQILADHIQSLEYLKSRCRRLMRSEMRAS